jgi:hypothetical protein
MILPFPQGGIRLLRLRYFFLLFALVPAGTAADVASSAAKGQQTNAFPPGMVAMFTGSTCPDGWTDEPLTQGRIPIGAASEAQRGEVVGKPFVENRTRPHSHAYSMSAELESSPMNLDNRFNTSWVLPQMVEFQGMTEERDTALPFYAIPMCRPRAQR